MRALMLRPDGVGAVVELADTDATATLRGLYAQIGGRYVQPVQLAADLVMWVDEDGLLADHPVMNRTATLLGGALGRSQVYVGTVVYTGADRHGTTLGLSDERVAWLRGQLESVGVTVANQSLGVERGGSGAAERNQPVNAPPDRASRDFALPGDVSGGGRPGP